MKKFILGVACMLALGTMSVNAQNNNNNCAPQKCVPEKCATQKCAPEKCARQNCGPQNCGPQNCAPRACGESRGSGCLLESLNLTDAQKTKLQEINKKYADRRCELFNQARDCKQNNDSVKQSVRSQARELKSQKLNDIKSVLTKEQYTQFLENYYLNGPDKGNFRKDGNRPHRHGYQGQWDACKDKKDCGPGKKTKPGCGDKR